MTDEKKGILINAIITKLNDVIKEKKNTIIILL